MTSALEAIARRGLSMREHTPSFQAPKATTVDNRRARTSIPPSDPIQTAVSRFFHHENHIDPSIATVKENTLVFRDTLVPPPIEESVSVFVEKNPDLAARIESERREAEETRGQNTDPLKHVIIPTR